MTDLAAVRRGFFDEPGIRIMLREPLGLAVHQLAIMGYERFGDPGMQLPSGAAQQRAVGRILDQGVLEQVRGLRWRSALKDQAGINEALERLLEAFF